MAAYIEEFTKEKHDNVADLPEEKTLDFLHNHFPIHLPQKRNLVKSQPIQEQPSFMNSQLFIQQVSVISILRRCNI